MPEAKYLQCGDTALTVEFGRVIEPEINSYVLALERAIACKGIIGVTECIPTFRSLCVCYNPILISGEKLQHKIEKLVRKLSVSSVRDKKVIHIPVLYGGSYGEDIENVARHTGLDIDEIIALHTGTDYLIYMLGFLPGFAYLGGMDKRLNTPRLENPRTKIHVGAVGIGGEQTGIYPLESPGGWQLIGTTPVKPYDKDRNPPILYNAGDYIRFFSVSEKEYREISEQVKSGTYVCKVTGGDEK